MDKETAKAEAKASKERAKEEAKLNKQKQQFLDATAAPSKRIQAFFAYCDLETDTSIIPTLHEYRSRIMLIVSEIIAFSDTQARKGKHFKEDDARSFIGALRKIIIGTPELLEGEFLRVICLALERMLFVEDAFAVRMMALEQLMNMIEAVPSFDTASKLLVSALNFSAYQDSAPGAILPPVHSSSDRTFVFVPAATGSSSSEPAPQQATLELVQQFLTWAERTPEKFVFWYERILGVLVLLFPEEAVAAQVPGAVGDRGFTRGTAPPDLQNMLYQQHVVAKWLK